MTTGDHLRNLEDWYVATLDRLYQIETAGFPILIIALPLLERFLRQKSGTFEKTKLNDQFYVELGRIFPIIAGYDVSRDFWQVYRNGLLHQVTFSEKKRKNSVVIPKGKITNFPEAIGVDPAGNFMVDPKKFAEKVVETILADFTTFDGADSPEHAFPYRSTGEPQSSLSPKKPRRPSP
jgi:hypothetical protein